MEWTSGYAIEYRDYFHDIQHTVLDRIPWEVHSPNYILKGKFAETLLPLICNYKKSSVGCLPSSPLLIYALPLSLFFAFSSLQIAESSLVKSSWDWTSVCLFFQVSFSECSPPNSKPFRCMVRNWNTFLEMAWAVLYSVNRAHAFLDTEELIL